MPYYALINGKHATPGLSSEEAILDFVKKGAERNHWPKMKDDDRDKYMIEIYDMEYQKKRHPEVDQQILLDRWGDGRST